MEKKDITIKIRISENDLDKLNKCSEYLGKSKSEIIRMGIAKIIEENEIVSDNELAYAEETIREDSTCFEKNVFTYNELVERLIQDIDAKTDEERYDKANQIMKSINVNGQYKSNISYLDNFTTIYRKASKNEIDKEKANREKQEKETDDFLKTPFMNSLMDSFR